MFFVGDVAPHGQCLTPQGLDSISRSMDGARQLGLPFLLRPGGDDDPAPFSGALQGGDRHSDAPAAAGDDGHLSFKFHRGPLIKKDAIAARTTAL